MDEGPCLLACSTGLLAGPPGCFVRTCACHVTGGQLAVCVCHRFCFASVLHLSPPIQTNWAGSSGALRALEGHM